MCALQELTVAVHAVVGTAPIDVYLKALRRKQLEEYHAAFEGEGHLCYVHMTPLSLSSLSLLYSLSSNLSLLLFQTVYFCVLYLMPSHFIDGDNRLHALHTVSSPQCNYDTLETHNKHQV